MADGGLEHNLAMTEMERQEFHLARMRLRDHLSKALTDVEDAIAQADRSGEIVGVKDPIYLLSKDVLDRAWAEVGKPLNQAAERRKREAPSA